MTAKKIKYIDPKTMEEVIEQDAPAPETAPMTMEQFDAACIKIADDFGNEAFAATKKLLESLLELLPKGRHLPKHLVAGTMANVMSKMETVTEGEQFEALAETLTKVDAATSTLAK